MITYVNGHKKNPVSLSATRVSTYSTTDDYGQLPWMARAKFLPRNLLVKTLRPVSRLVDQPTNRTFPFPQQLANSGVLRRSSSLTVAGQCRLRTELPDYPPEGGT